VERLRGALRSWVKYVPVALIGKLYSAGVEAGIGVRYCSVTVFFCDFDGLEQSSMALGPQALLQLLGEAYDRVNAAVEKHQGTLLEFIGSEILAVFNAPDQIPDHAGKALAAALEVQARTGAGAGGCFESMHLRIGVHTGRVLVGNIGAPSRMKYGLLGDDVNIAARLKSLNTRYGTSCLTSDATLEAGSRRDFLARPVGHLVLKGRRVPTSTWELMHLRAGAPPGAQEAAQHHERGFQAFQGRRFEEARALFKAAGVALARGAARPADGPSAHLVQLCDHYLDEPPPADWDGSEHLHAK